MTYTIRILVKGSGDVVKKEGFVKFLIALAQSKRGKVTVIPGAGGDINEALIEKGYEPRFDSRDRRITETPEEKEIALLELLEARNKLLDKVADYEIEVAPLVACVGSNPCNINGDDVVDLFHRDFTEVYIVTTLDRVKEKMQKFSKKQFPNVEIIGM